MPIDRLRAGDFISRQLRRKFFCKSRRLHTFNKTVEAKSGENERSSGGRLAARTPLAILPPPPPLTSRFLNFLGAQAALNGRRAASLQEGGYFEQRARAPAATARFEARPRRVDADAARIKGAWRALNATNRTSSLRPLASPSNASDRSLVYTHDDRSSSSCRTFRRCRDRRRCSRLINERAASQRASIRRRRLFALSIQPICAANKQRKLRLQRIHGKRLLKAAILSAAAPRSPRRRRRRRRRLLVVVVGCAFRFKTFIVDRSRLRSRSLPFHSDARLISTSNVQTVFCCSLFVCIFSIINFVYTIWVASIVSNLASVCARLFSSTSRRQRALMKIDFC